MSAYGRSVEIRTGTSVRSNSKNTANNIYYRTFLSSNKYVPKGMPSDVVYRYRKGLFSSEDQAQTLYAPFMEVKQFFSRQTLPPLISYRDRPLRKASSWAHVLHLRMQHPMRWKTIPISPLLPRLITSRGHPHEDKVGLSFYDLVSAWQKTCISVFGPLVAKIPLFLNFA